MVTIITGYNYESNLISVTARDGQDSDIINVSVSYEKVTPPITYSDSSQGSGYRLYKRSGSSWVEVNIGLSVREITGGRPAYTPPQSVPPQRKYLYLYGSTSQTGTYYLLDSTKTYGVQVDVQSESTSNTYSLNYYDSDGNRFSLLKFPINCLGYGVPLDLNGWSGSQTGYHGNTVQGKIVNGRFYAFDHWETNLGNYSYGGVLALLYPSDGMNLTAIFSSTPYVFTVRLRRYNGNETSYTETSTNVTSGDTYTSPTTPDTRAHYVFRDWYNDMNSTSLPYGTVLTIVYQDITIVSRWNGAQYTVTYNINTTGTTPSSIASATVTYPNTITFPSLTKPNYTFTGWTYDGVTYAPGSTYKPVDNTTFTSAFIPLSYRVTFKDADGTIETTTAYTNFGTAVNIPSAPNRPAFNFKWWSSDGSTTQAISKTATTYSPSSVSENQQTIVFIRRYNYTRTLKSTSNQEYYTTEAVDYPSPLTLPTQESHDQNMEMSGYRIKGWSTTRQTPSISTNPTVQYTSQYTPNLSDTSSVLYIAMIPATLNSITIGARLLVRVGVSAEVSKNTNPPSVVIDPPDWLGTLTWVSTDTDETYYTVRSSGTQSATVTGKNSTFSASQKYVTAKARKETWNPSSTYVTSNSMLIDVSEYLQIDFYTRDDNGSLIPYTVAGHDGNSWFVDNANNQLVWKNMDGTTTNAYPTNPIREDHTFVCWTDGDEVLVDQSHPPDHPTICTASWMRKYESTDRDVLIFQRFNKDGNALMLELDTGVITSVNENFATTLTVTPTPTMPSDMTFITDMNCTETIPFKFIRKHPIDYNDDTDDSRRWSNGKWIEELRSLVDRWQSETDGIKVLYIPNGLRMTTVLGETICYGKNYDLLGYCLPSSNNIGILYDNDTKVLVGYNAIISSYSDTYTSGSNSVIEVGITITLGGMTSQYQDWADSLLLRDRQ